jgi:glyoxylase-like metal-dependent hydrolase (beta-lactamase superfamily II)
MLALEDLFTDVIAKAQRGLGLTDAMLAGKAGLSLADLQSLKAGSVDEEALKKIAPALSLKAAALIDLAQQAWTPRPIDLPGLAQFNTTYHDMTVNAYLVWDSSSKLAAAFDTGADARPMMEFIKANGLTLEAIYLTHTHPDHVADIATLRTAGQPVRASRREPWDSAELFDCGKEFTLGHLHIETRQTWGHSRGGVTYVIDGLERPVAIVGDALFCSSMGGGIVSYADALATNQKEIFSLPDDTVVCPGHGPLTTVGEEKRHNPFYSKI